MAEIHELMLNALTIDVEDYYHVSGFESAVRTEDWNRYESRVERNTNRLLRILDDHGTKATFFVLGWVAERFPDLVRYIRKCGHEIGSHGYAHQRITTQSPDRFREETRKSKDILENIIGEPVRGYRAASYSIVRRNLWALDILNEEGFWYDSSIFPIYHDRYGIPGYPRFCHQVNGGNGLVEFPLSTCRIVGINIPVAGGGYFRLFPYRFIRWALQRINTKENQPGVVYLHPWEIDPDQPRISAGPVARWRQYRNLGKMEGILVNLVRDFQFSTALSVLRQQGLLGTDRDRNA